MNSLNYLSIKNKIVINRDFYIIINFEMKTFKTGLKHYWFNAEHFNGDAKICRIHYLEEKYEENKAKQKILKFYKNYFYFNDINIPKNNSLNVIKIRDRGRNLKASDINKIFGIKKNNYSVQEIYLNFNNKAEKYYYFLIKNINKYKVLNKLYLFDCISKNIIMNFIERISKLYLLEKIYIIINDKLSNQEIKSIKKLLPIAEVKIDIKEKKSIITQNFVKDRNDDIFEIF